ncbi:hypothetical protein [Streptomyces specialis]|uniref:hypothetical protein n=1 Tax=Streptomyces specialis TaxID=498367 RepID=UPI00073E8C48|nr:hypothetical protein [Streptomyces specialis]
MTSRGANRRHPCRILPPALGCWPIVPISVGDVPYLDGVQTRLNTMIGDRAAAAGATLVSDTL